MFILPRYCTQNWTCEIEQTTALQCNAQAHMVNKMRIYTVDCANIDDCYQKKTNKSYLQEFVDQLLEEEEMAIVPFQPPSPTASVIAGPNKKQQSIGSSTKLSQQQSVLLGVGASGLEPYEFDKDDILQQQLTPLNFDRLETLDSGLTWAIKSQLKIKKIHLVVCVAHNEIGESISSRIILPSGLKKGKLSEVVMVNQRNNDKEVVEGDNVNVEFMFNNIVYG